MNEVLDDEPKHLMEYILPLFPNNFKGIAIDIGAYDPIWINNTYELEQRGWNCYCIEPNPHMISKLKLHRKNVLEYAVGNRNEDNVNFYIFQKPIVNEAGDTGLIYKDSMRKYLTETIKVKLRTFSWLMGEQIHENHIDLLSIDVEGTEMDVLSTFDSIKWQPKVIIIENLSQTIDQHIWFKEHGYTRNNRLVFNDIYVKNNT